MDIGESILFELIDTVKARYSDRKSIRTMVKECLDDVGIEPTTVLRRDHDGCSEAAWLLEKMIGELLKDGKINF